MKIKTKTNEILLKNLKRKATEKVVVLLSGGVDSVATTVFLKEKGFKVFPLFIDYGQNARTAEEYAAKSITKKLGIRKIKIIKTDFYHQLKNVPMCDGEVSTVDEAWVAGRNTFFMIMAGIYAEKIGADGISLGYMLEDNFVFGDNDFFHHKEIENILAKSFLRPFQVFMPVKHLSKKELIGLLKQRGLFDLTTSCWNAKLTKNKISSCHRCANCKERDYLAKEI